MKKIQFSLFVSLLVLFTMFLSAPAQASAQGKRPVKRPLKQAKQVKQAVKMTAPTTGILYKISGNGLKKPSYFRDVSHHLSERYVPITTLNSYLTASDQLVLEVDMDDPEEMGAAALATFMPEGKTLADFLTPEEYDKVEAYLKSNKGMTLKYLRKIKPMVIRTLVAPKTFGCDTAVSYEMSFVQIARAGKNRLKGWKPQPHNPLFLI